MKLKMTLIATVAATAALAYVPAVAGPLNEVIDAMGPARVEALANKVSGLDAAELVQAVKDARPGQLSEITDLVESVVGPIKAAKDIPFARKEALAEEILRRLDK